MNTDPPGTDEDIIDVIDVFVLCGNSSDATLLGQQLSPRGYHVTLFTDCTQLSDQIRAGKPNLLICDATSPEPDGYEFCRQLKADDDLWMIPVLLITGVSSRADLLKVLDSNADNFVTRPYDHGEFLSLIEDLIAERVEKPDPEQLKTRFKIRHDDREYVIMADRYKLLEILLSSYDLAVDRAKECTRVETELKDLTENLECQVKDRTQALSDEVKRLDGLVKEHTRSHAQKDRNIQDQERVETDLRVLVQDNEAIISRQAATITKITDELDQKNSRYAEAEAEIRTLTADTAQVEQSLHTEIDALCTERDGFKTELESTKRAHSEAQKQIVALESRNANLAQEKIKTESTLRSCSLETDKVKSALAEHKNRANIAEQEVQSKIETIAESEEKIRTLMADKTQVEQSLHTEIDALCTDRDGFKTELESTKRAHSEGQNQIVALESRNVNLAQEKGETELTLRSCSLEIDEVKSALAEHKNRANIAEQEVQSKIETIAESEEKIRTLTADKAQVEQSLHTEIDALCAERDDFKTELESTKRAHSEAQNQIVALESRNANLAQEKGETESTLRSCSLETDEVKSALAEHKNRANIAEQEIKSVMQAKAESEHDLQQTVNTLSEKVKQLADDLVKQKAVLDSETQRRIAFEQQIRILSQEKEKKEAALGAEKESNREHRDALLEKFNATTALLGAERQKNTTLSAEIQTVSLAKEQLSREMHTITRRLAIAETAHEEETQLRLRSEKNAKDALSLKDDTVNSHQALLASLDGDLKTHAEKLDLAYRERDTLKSSRKRLEDELAVAVLGKVQSEKFAQSLSHEMEQLRAALETERRQRKSVEDSLEKERQLHLLSEKSVRDTLGEKDEAVKSHQALLASLNDDLKTHAEKLELANREQDTIKISRKKLEDELAATVLGKVQSEKFAQSLSHDIEQLRAALETERQQRKSVEESRDQEKQAKDHIEQRLRTVTGEKGHEHDNLVIKFKKLNEDVEKGIALQTSLEQKLAATVQQQSEKEDALRTLSKEFEQLLAAFKAEQKNRHDLEEQLADTRENTQVKEDTEGAHNHALTIKGSTLPRVIEHPEKSISIVDSVQPPRDPVIVPVEQGLPSTPTQDEISAPNIQSVEDLFEDDHEMDICELPNATIEPEPVNKEVAVDSGTGHSGIAVFAEPDTANVKSDSPVEELAKETGGKEEAAITTNNAVPMTADTGAGEITRAADTNKKSETAKVQRIGTLDKHRVSPAPGSMKFDRRQWFDLIKWAHNTSSLSREEKLRFVRLGRLIQNGRNLNPRQEDQVSELVALAHSMGYKPG